MTKFQYRINDESVKDLFTLTGSSQSYYGIEVDWLDLSLVDRQLLVNVYGIREVYNVSDIPQWSPGYTRSPMDGLHEYESIFNTVDELMDAAREVIKQACEKVRKDKYDWVMEKLNSHSQMILHLHKWRADVSKLSPEEQYQEYTSKLESLKKFSDEIRTVPDDVYDDEGNDLSWTLAGIVGDYRALLADIQKYKKTCTSFAFLTHGSKKV